MTDAERRALFEAIRVQRYRLGWNDAMSQRPVPPEFHHDLSYRAGRRDAATVARRPR